MFEYARNSTRVQELSHPFDAKNMLKLLFQLSRHVIVVAQKRIHKYTAAYLAYRAVSRATARIGLPFTLRGRNHL